MPTVKPARPLAFYDGDCYVPSESVGHRLFHVVLGMRREVEARMAQHGLTDAQWKPLWLLKAGPANTACELAREMEIDAGAMTRTLDRLVGKGLIERLRSETDRRVVHLTLTAAGEAAVAEVPHVLASVNNDLLHGFSEQEWLQLRGFLQRMLANARDLPTAKEAA